MTLQNENNTGINAFNPLTWDDDAKVYFNFVNRVMREKSDMPFSNGRPLHAIYLIHEFFRNAEREMRLFSGNLARRVKGDERVDKNMRVYSDPYIIDAVKDFLSREGADLKIVIEKPLDVDKGQDLESHPLVHAVKSLRDEGGLKGNFKLCQVNPSVTNAAGDNSTHPNRQHLMLMDKSAFRIEIDHEKSEAYVCVNDKNLSKILVDFFDETLYKNGKLLCSIEAPGLAA